MMPVSAAAAGTFRIGGEIEVVRLGYGAMRITGPGIWGPPHDRPEALRVLKRLPELGINFIDTANSYGPGVSEQLIHEALSPYTGLTVATKAGLARSGPDRWAPRGDGEYLWQEALGSRERLGVKRVDLWQLHRIDPKIERVEQFETVRRLIDAKVIRFAGLSEVSVRDIEEARRYFPVATVQNQYSLADRRHEQVLEYCEANGIGFIPFFPLAAGSLNRADGPLATIARSRGVTPGQIAIAWLLERSPVMIPIPGTSKVAHQDENAAAAGITLTARELESLDQVE
jgi:pyridoxine 4-dehydrogenase